MKPTSLTAFVRRSVAAGATILFLAASCSSAVDVAQDPSSSPTLGTAAPEVVTQPEADEPTASAEPEPETGVGSPRDCTAGDGGVTGDFDGDGFADSASVTDQDGVLRLSWCVSNGDSSAIDLAEGVWYLSTFDIEGDGTDELMYAFQEAGDTADLPAYGNVQFLGVNAEGRLQNLGLNSPTGPYLSVSTDRFEDQFTGSGFGCVDLNNDGSRQLVRVRGSYSLDDRDVVDWYRDEIVLDPEGSRVGEVTQGQFTNGADDAAIALLGQGSCGDQRIELRRTGPSDAVCQPQDNIYQELADLDGDGKDDVGYARQRTEGSFFTIGVCTSTGLVDERVVGGQGRVFGLVDQDLDGVFEVWAGDTTVPAGAWQIPHIVRDGNLVAILSADGSPFVAQDGWSLVNNQNDLQLAYLGCGDADENGVNEIVQLTALTSTSGSGTDWTSTHYEVQDGVAVEVSTNSGTLAGAFSDDLVIDEGLDEALLRQANTCP